MKLVEIKCKNCGQKLKLPENETKVKCESCRSEYFIDDVEDEAYRAERGKRRAEREHYEELAKQAYERHLKATTSNKSKKITTILCCMALVGCGGLHDLYLGHISRGMLKIFTINWFLLGFVVDIIKIRAGKYLDADNKYVRK